MSEHLARLSLTSSDVASRLTNVIPAMALRYATCFDVQAKALDPNEMEKINALMKECKFDETVIMPNFDARCGLYMPPTGFVASMHKDTTFRIEMIDRDLFRGVGICHIERTTRYTDAQVQQAFMRMNQFIRDVSPAPPVYGSQSNEWICSLGGNGWIGVYERREGTELIKHQYSQGYSIVVVNRMDDGAYENCYQLLRQNYHEKTSVNDALLFLHLYRTTLYENRGRLIALVLALLDEKSESTMAAPEQAYEKKSALEQTIPDIVWEWLPPPPFRIPIWYSLPKQTPRDCLVPLPPNMACYPLTDNFTPEEVLERVEQTPVRVLQNLDLVIDDFMPFSFALSDRIVRYAGCSQATDYSILVRGPLYPILISNQAGPAAAFQAFPSQCAMAEREETKLARAIPHTWEDPELEENRLVAQVYSSAFLKVFGKDLVSSYEPQFVRVSCMDALGRVRKPNSRKRMVGFSVDKWSGL